MTSWRENPLLRRELLYRLRPLPSQRGLLLVVAVLCLLAVALAYWAGLDAYIRYRGLQGYRDLLIITLVVETLLVCAGAPAATANAVSREREQRTWDLLTITLLNPHEIVLGKLVGRALPLLLVLVLGLPMKLLCLIGDYRLAPGMLLGTLSVLVTLALYTTGGLVASCLSQKTVTATALSYLFAGVWVIGTVILFGLTNLLVSGWTSPEPGLFWVALNPLAVIEPTMTKYTPSPYSPTNDALHTLSPWLLLGTYGALTVFLVWLLIATYRRWAYR
jgi:ABC-type transport system involved in multi-copper enzyme maturation permease subunit